MALIATTKTELKNGKEIVFRTILSSDAETFLNFRKQVPLESTHTMQYVGMKLPSIDEVTIRLTKQLDDKVLVNVGAFDQDRLVGYLNFRPWAVDHPWTLHLAEFGMMVLKEYWGLGIAKKLLDIQDAHARSIGVTRIEALVRTKNERAIKIYERNGFKIEGTRKRAANINNELNDEYFIAKILDDPSIHWRPPYLETERLILRPVKLSDAEAIFEYAKNPAVSEYILWEPHQSVEDSLSYIQDYIFDYYKKGVPEPFGIALKENPEKLIGTVGCFVVSKVSKSMELAYALAENHWGQGLMTEAAVAVMDYCFKEFGLKRIQARCKVENIGSRRVMEKAGMTFEGTLKSAQFHRGRFWDMHYLAKVAE
ncbi:MAG: GNAT family N-acetyltransferase [Bdellovibrio sp.]|nr:GNAT family N-acetyltransferase [Bdellovibrio sp.]